MSADEILAYHQDCFEYVRGIMLSSFAPALANVNKKDELKTALALLNMSATTQNLPPSQLLILSCIQKPRVDSYTQFFYF
jgi:hypothetical protein